MNREILFRGKKKKNGEWTDGYLFDNDFPGQRRFFIGSLIIDDYIGPACDEWDINGTNFYEVKPDTICQYTELDDMNDTKIWENDIVKCGGCRGVIRYKDGCFSIKWINDTLKIRRTDLAHWVHFRTIQVIGNVFDNPELLEKAKGDK